MTKINKAIALLIMAATGLAAYWFVHYALPLFAQGAGIKIF